MKHRLLLLIALLCTFAGSAQADTHFNDPNMTWISHNPSVKEPGGASYLQGVCKWRDYRGRPWYNLHIPQFSIKTERNIYSER